LRISESLDEAIDYVLTEILTWKELDGCLSKHFYSRTGV